jgi:hypothetical protein
MGCVISNVLTGRWPRGTMPFVLDKGFSPPLQNAINAAIAHWNDPAKGLPVRLVPHAKEPDYVRFTRNPIPNLGGPTTNTHESSASQFLGRHHGMQLIFCGDGAKAGSIIHEIGHAFGLAHEQNREDRNQFVDIHWDNIPLEERSQFSQNHHGTEDTGPYDFASIMHYGAFAYAKDPASPTITTKPPGISIGQRNGLSAGDMAAIRFLYRAITFSVPALTIDPPPVTVAPPALTVTPPAITTNSYSMSVTPPPITVGPTTVTPPPVNVNVPGVTVTPPPLTVTPPSVTVDPPPITITPPPITI